MVSVQIRRELRADRPAVQRLIGAAFRPAGQAAGPVMEEVLNNRLRADPGWSPALTLVADVEGAVVGQVTSSYGVLVHDSGLERRMIGVGPVGVLPARQGVGIGSALMGALIAAADAAGEPALVLLGSPDFYARFGFVPAADLRIEAPDPLWGKYFQVLTLRAYDQQMTGRFRYAAPFDGI